MPQILALQYYDLCSVAGMYMHLEHRFGKDLCQCSAAKQKKAVRYLRKCYAEIIPSLSNEVADFLQNEIQHKELLTFMQACVTEMKRRSKEKQASEALIVDTLDELARWLFRLAMDSDEQCRIDHLPNGDIALRVDETPAFRRSLVLQNAVLSPEYENAACVEWISGIGMADGQYILFEQEREILRFSSVRGKIDCYNATKGIYYWDDPWSYLFCMISAILQKADMPGEHLNEQEKQLLPLLREVYRLDFQKDFPYLFQLSRETGCNTAKIEKFLKKCHKMNFIGRFRYLSRAEFEPLWRALFERIRCSQQDYPVLVEQLFDSFALQKTRRAIEAFFRRNGFSGQYPDFEMDGQIRGLHLVESYGMSYFCGHEKKAKMLIHCEEHMLEDDQYAVQFLCGTALMRKNAAPMDAYSCCFAAAGRRLFWWVRDGYLRIEPRNPVSHARTMRLAAIAVKRVRLQKLTKEEKQLLNPLGRSVSGIFWLWLLFGGGFFAVTMVAAFMLIGGLLIGLLGSWQEVWPFLSTFPWHLVLAFCWIGFGLPMGIVASLAKQT